MSLMRDETLAAPEAVAAFLAQTRAIAGIAAQLRKLDPPFVVICARGSSSHAGTFLRVLLARRLGLVAAPAMPSIASVYNASMRLRGALFIAISQSGGSPDLLSAAQQARRDGARTLAIVNDVSSVLADACEMVLPMQAGPERSVAATKTVLTSLAASLALVEAWSGDGLTEAALERLPARLAQSCTLDWSALVKLLAMRDHIFTVGRGPALGIAREAALKLAETCGIAGLAFSTAELAHGPMALVGPEFPVLAFLQDDASRPLSEGFLAGLAERGPVLAAGGQVRGGRRCRCWRRCKPKSTCCRRSRLSISPPRPPPGRAGTIPTGRRRCKKSPARPDYSPYSDPAGGAESLIVADQLRP